MATTLLSNFLSPSLLQFVADKRPPSKSPKKLSLKLKTDEFGEKISRASLKNDGLDKNQENGKPLIFPPLLEDSKLRDEFLAYRKELLDQSGFDCVDVDLLSHGVFLEIFSPYPFFLNQENTILNSVYGRSWLNFFSPVLLTRGDKRRPFVTLDDILRVLIDSFKDRLHQQLYERTTAQFIKQFSDFISSPFTTNLETEVLFNPYRSALGQFWLEFLELEIDSRSSPPKIITPTLTDDEKEIYGAFLKHFEFSMQTHIKKGETVSKVILGRFTGFLAYPTRELLNSSLDRLKENFPLDFQLSYQRISDLAQPLSRANPLFFSIDFLTFIFSKIVANTQKPIFVKLQNQLSVQDLETCLHIQPGKVPSRLFNIHRGPSLNRFLYRYTLHKLILYHFFFLSRAGNDDFQDSLSEEQRTELEASRTLTLAYIFDEINKLYSSEGLTSSINNFDEKSETSEDDEEFDSSEDENDSPQQDTSYQKWRKSLSRELKKRIKFEESLFEENTEADPSDNTETKSSVT